MSEIDVPALLRAHDARVTELLEANGREVERRRAAEAKVAELEAEIRLVRLLIPQGGPYGPAWRSPDLYDPYAVVRGNVDTGLMPRNDVALPAEGLAEDQAEWNKEQRW